MPRPKIVVSWISLVWPLLSVKLGAILARMLGFDGFQGAPTRGLPAHSMDLRDYIPAVHQICPILFYEDVWSHAEPWDSISKLIFGNPQVARRRMQALEGYLDQKQLIGHDSGRLVEIHPGMRLTPNQIRDKLDEQIQEVVWDTMHVRRDWLFGHQGSESDLPVGFWKEWQDWRELLRLFAPLVTIVHFQPHRKRREELWQWLLGRQCELGDMMLALKQNCPNIRAYVVELAPPEGGGIKGLVAKAAWVFFLPLTMSLVRLKLSRTI